MTHPNCLRGRNFTGSLNDVHGLISTSKHIRRYIAISTLDLWDCSPSINQSVSHPIELSVCGAGSLVYLQPNWCVFGITLVTHLVGNRPTHSQMVTIHAWLHVHMHLFPHSLLIDMLNHWQHFAMCFYSLTNMMLCWAFIQCFCVAVMHQDCGECIDRIHFVITSLNVQVDQFSFCLCTHILCVMQKPGFTWHFGSKPMSSVYKLMPKRQACCQQKVFMLMLTR